MWLDVEALGLLAALAGDRIRAEEPGVLDQLGPAKSLQNGVHLADVHRPAEWPASPVGPADDRVEVGIERVERLLLEANRVLARPCPQFGDHGDAPVDRRLDDRPRPDDPALLEAIGDLLEGLLARHELLEAEPAVRRRRGGHDEDA